MAFVTLALTRTSGVTTRLGSPQTSGASCTAGGCQCVCHCSFVFNFQIKHSDAPFPCEVMSTCLKKGGAMISHGMTYVDPDLTDISGLSANQLVLHIIEHM